MAALVGIINSEVNNAAGSDLRSMLTCISRNHNFSAGSDGVVQSGLRLGWNVNPMLEPPESFQWDSVGEIGCFILGEVYSSSPSFHSNDLCNVAVELAKAYRRGGTAALLGINGWFSGVIVDKRDHTLVLFNDRFGLGRIYYATIGTAFYFASEAKALLKVQKDLRALDWESVAELVTCSAVLENRSIFKGVRLLPPGSCWLFRSGKLAQTASYFKPDDWTGATALTEKEFYTQLSSTWQRILPRYIRQKDDAAVSLTGGVDSRMILAWYPNDTEVRKAYTFSGRYRDCADVSLARQIASITRHEHYLIPIGAGFLNNFPTLAPETVYLSDGRMDVTGAIDLYVQHPARKIAPIRVTGTNGGEMLRRLVAFKPIPPQPGIFAPEFEERIQAVHHVYQREMRDHPLSFTAFKQAPWYMNSKFVLEREHLVLRMPYFDNDLVALSFRAPASMATSNEVALRLIADGNSRVREIGTDRGSKIDNHFGFTLLHHAFQQFTFKAEYAFDYGMPQWLARWDRLLRPMKIENVFLGRHKFHHFRVFYRDELAGYLRETLLEKRSVERSYLNKKSIVKLVDEHVTGRGNHTLELHKLLTLELIHRTLLESN